jgi:hypothetical protein
MTLPVGSSLVFRRVYVYGGMSINLGAMLPARDHSDYERDAEMC